MPTQGYPMLTWCNSLLLLDLKQRDSRLWSWDPGHQLQKLLTMQVRISSYRSEIWLHIIKTIIFKLDLTTHESWLDSSDPFTSLWTNPTFINLNLFSSKYSCYIWFILIPPNFATHTRIQTYPAHTLEPSPRQSAPLSSLFYNLRLLFPKSHVVLIHLNLLSHKLLAIFIEEKKNINNLEEVIIVEFAGCYVFKFCHIVWVSYSHHDWNNL